MQIITKCKDC
jgi:hypothetical protein